MHTALLIQLQRLSFVQIVFYDFHFLNNEIIECFTLTVDFFRLNIKMVNKDERKSHFQCCVY